MAHDRHHGKDNHLEYGRSSVNRHPKCYPYLFGVLWQVAIHADCHYATAGVKFWTSLAYLDLHALHGFYRYYTTNPVVGCTRRQPLLLALCWSPRNGTPMVGTYGWLGQLPRSMDERRLC